MEIADIHEAKSELSKLVEQALFQNKFSTLTYY